MTASTKGTLRALLLSATALAGLSAGGAAYAQEAIATNGAAGADAPGQVGEIVVTTTRTTRSSVTLAGPEVQKILPGISPLKGIETLPGVVFETADPWGNNEQNLALFVHGFSTQQLGYTMDNVPLGDPQYGNYNGLSVSRAVTSENVKNVVLSSGAGVLGVASTSNLGGAIETFSSDPLKERAADLRETVGSYETTRTFLRFDTGNFSFLGGDAGLYVSGLHHDAEAWDFNGHQRDDQVNLKFVADNARAKLTLFADWDNKVEPNEDATSFGNQQTAAAAGFTPYTREFIYPNLAGCVAYVARSAANGNLPGTPPTAAGNNFTNCFSAAQRTDLLTYAKLEYKVTDAITWSNQAYYHYDYGRGIVAGRSTRRACRDCSPPIIRARSWADRPPARPPCRTSPTRSAAPATRCAPPNTASTAKACCRRRTGTSPTTTSRRACGGSTTNRPSTASGTRSRPPTTT